ncbi:MAG: outer membrane beta-barrel protein [Chitinophagaceae bacterium]
MKKIITLALISFVLIASKADAQLKKGEKMLGGSIAISTQKSETEFPGFPASETKQTSISILPQLGFGLGSNWIAGINAGVNYTKAEEGTETMKINIYTIGVFARKFHPVGERFGFFGEASAAYGRGTSKFENASTKRNNTTFGVSVVPGAYFRANRRFIIEAGIGGIQYLHAVSEPSNPNVPAKSTSDIFNFSLTDNLSLGFKVIL